MFIDNSHDILLRKQRNLPSVKKHPNNISCKAPSTVITVSTEGNIYSCTCPMHLPYIVANVLDLNSFEELWDTPTVKEIIKTIDARTFDYCDTTMCGLAKIDNESALQIGEYWYSEETNIIIGVDDSCNLQCPSCRLVKRDYNKRNTDFNISVFNTITKIHTHLLTLINNYNKKSLIQIGGTGDPFYSLATVNLVSKLEYNSLHRYKFKTNGMSMKAVLPKLKILPSIELIDISLDAATKETHEKVRTGSNWNKVIDNIKWLLDLPNRPRVEVNFTVQNDNFREVPEFRELMINEIGVDNIVYTLYEQWPHITDEIYTQNAIHLSTHPNHTECVEILKSAPWLDGQIYHFLQELS